MGYTQRPLQENDISLVGLNKAKKQQLIDTLEEYDRSSTGSPLATTVKSAPAAQVSPKKRAASPTSGPATKQPKLAPDVDNAQVATSSTVRVPIDETCPHTTYRVYVGPHDKVIYDASLNQTNAGENANKFYRIQLLQGSNGDYKVWTRWGRVGERGQNATLGDGSFQDALSQFEKKFKDKSGHTWAARKSDPKPKKYVFVERSYAPDDEDDILSMSASPQKRSSYSPPKCTLPSEVRSLMDLIFNQEYFEATMDSLNYDANKLPLGRLSKDTIMRGFSTLKELSALVNNLSLAQSSYQSTPQQAIEHLSNRYYSYIPHAFGRTRPPVISSDHMIKREIELMESLSELKNADDIIKSEGDGALHPADARFQALGLQEMTPLQRGCNEFKQIQQYLLETNGETHGYQYNVKDIFRVERRDELERQRSKYANITSDRRLLWHGSRATNFGGILAQGLRIAPPEAPVSGYMFGKGVYLADMSSKSAGYCYPHISNGDALLLLCEAELGDPMQELKDADYDAGDHALQRGVHSTLGLGMTGPARWKDAGCVHESLKGVAMPDTSAAPPGPTGLDGLCLQYNEYICYDVAQVRLRYLLRVTMNDDGYI